MSLVERRRADLWFLTLTLVLGALEVAAAFWNPLNLAADEAHYWEWARRLDWSYYSKGPLVAYLIAGNRLLFGDTVLSVRLPAIVCFNLFSFVFYAFLRRQVMPTQALWGWIALRSMLIMTQMGIFMSTDAPAALFWLMAVVGAHRALLQESSDGWLLFGLSVGTGMLAKYTLGILVPSVFLLLALTPALRHHFRDPRFWFGLVICAVILTPVIVWNAEHGWVNFAHNMTHLASSKSHGFNPQYLPELFFGQFGLVGPVIFIGIGLALVRAYRFWREGDIEAGLFFWTAVPLLALCVVTALTKRVYQNWPIPLYISGLLAACHVFARGFIAGSRSRAWVHAGILLSAVMTAGAHLPLFGITLGIPPQWLPTKKLVGWDGLGNQMEIELNVLRATERVEPVVIADEYATASEVAFYAPSHPRALCALLDERRMNQYDLWGGWKDIAEKPAVVIVRNPERLNGIRSHFVRTEPAGDPLPYTVEYLGKELQKYWIIRGYGYDGHVFPLPDAR